MIINNLKLIQSRLQLTAAAAVAAQEEEEEEAAAAAVALGDIGEYNCVLKLFLVLVCDNDNNNDDNYQDGEAVENPM